MCCRIILGSRASISEFFGRRRTGRGAVPAPSAWLRNLRCNTAVKHGAALLVDRGQGILHNGFVVAFPGVRSLISNQKRVNHNILMTRYHAIPSLTRSYKPLGSPYVQAPCNSMTWALPTEPGTASAVNMQLHTCLSDVGHGGIVGNYRCSCRVVLDHRRLQGATRDCRGPGAPKTDVVLMGSAVERPRVSMAPR